ncbi:ribosome-associated ATPase/putative transporter RbbA [Reyranella sp.]|uniref:ribosome-associated ATPase/putative transporter RbbA n=1 Tax=Reyranella sp. TaxID=1929291 RepID=UPI003D11E9E9
MDAPGVVVRIDGLRHRFGRLVALDGISLTIPTGTIVGLIGPDGVGKSTLLGLIAGAKRCQGGMLEVLGGSMRSSRHRRAICARIAYMPQGLGKNLYPDLSVEENIDFFGRLFGHGRAERKRRIRELLAATGLTAFASRPAGKLSGGMRQKLGLCCSLVHDPDLLILDEPTTGVDPLSRRQFWELIDRIRARRPQMSVIVATAYMEEAERFGWLVAMNAGAILATGTPATLKERAGVDTIEDAFVALLPDGRGRRGRRPQKPPRAGNDREIVIAARGLTCRFGDFTAVDHVSFDIERGEIFGFVGSNGCGKTTTMKMLTGLLPASEGTATLFGKPLAADGMESRMRVGYMSQSFSLYTELTVRQNLDLHARLFHLPAAKARARVADLVQQFRLADHVDQLASDIPLGIRQRLSLAVAVVHQPDLLILDEPTSGVDPLARDLFWQLLIDLSREAGVTIFVSTHFMNEAARCDRIALMDAGRVLMTGTPQAITQARGAVSLDDAFVSFLEEAKGAGAAGDLAEPPAGMPARIPTSPVRARREDLFSLRRLLAYAVRESLELMRDPIRLAFALGGTAFLMLIFGFGITTDVNSLSFAALDRDNSFESRAYLGELRGSPYFAEQPPLADARDLQDRLKRGEVMATIEIPPGFGRDLRRGRPAQVGVWIDGAMPFRAETIRGYLEGAHAQFLSDAAIRGHGGAVVTAPLADVSLRFRYNQDFDSIYAMVPAQFALQLALIPAILMALAIVREKELGSIVNLYVTPVTRLEFLLGKQIPYVAVAMVNFAIMFLMSIFVFDVPIKGSFLALLIGAFVYVLATTAYGRLISAFTSTQIAALFGTAIMTVLPATMFAGMMTPVSSLTGFAALLGRFFPMTYFLPISVGTFTKGLGLGDLSGHLLALAAFVPALTLLSLLLMRPQEK